MTASRDRCGRGTTLVEVVVALLVLTTGLLALAGTGAAVTRLASGAWLNTQLAALLSERLEVAAAAACSSPDAGRESRGPLRLRWMVVDAAPGRVVTVWAAAPGVRGVRALTVSRFVGCRG